MSPGANHRLQILLAEDNIVNQKLATSILEKAGHRVILAPNGAEALRKWRESQFDLVFMDVQMPEMDGLEATRQIRAAEQATGKHTPIIALTAHVMKGDRERCFAAGMDDYISKPFQKQQLLSALDRLAQAGACEAARHSREQTATAELIDSAELLSRVEGDRELLGELIDTLLSEARPLFEALTDAVKSSNPDRLERVAHKLKGAIAVFGARDAVITAQTLEYMGREGKLHNAEQSLHQLEAQLVELQVALSELRETCPKS